ncbi:MAG: carboxypeptidase regulatory-like domain-containing protein [Novipirellula sp. JB048]
MWTRMFLKACSTGLLAAVLLTAVGCTSEEKPAGMPELQPVTLTIQQDGAPLPAASVQLIGTGSEASQWVSGGSTDDNGQVVVMTHGRYKGAPVGTYKVTVSKTLVEGSTMPSDDPGASSSAKSYHVVQAQYRDASSTPIEIEITSGGNTNEVIDVGAAVKDPVPML